jgi:hypothetical protein
LSASRQAWIALQIPRGEGSRRPAQPRFRPRRSLPECSCAVIGFFRQRRPRCRLPNRASHCDELLGSEHSVMQAAFRDGREMQCRQTGGIAKITNGEPSHACALCPGALADGRRILPRGPRKAPVLAPSRCRRTASTAARRNGASGLIAASSRVSFVLRHEGAGAAIDAATRQAAILLIARGCHTRIGIST